MQNAMNNVAYSSVETNDVVDINSAELEDEAEVFTADDMRYLELILVGNPGAVRDNNPGIPHELPADGAESTVPANESELIAPPNGGKGRGGASGRARGRSRGGGGGGDAGAKGGARGGARGRARGGAGGRGSARGGVRGTSAGRGRGRNRDPTLSAEASPISRGPGRPRQLQAVNPVDAVRYFARNILK
uniref:Uncharacterized protein n=1 Tax=Trichogramma kaykai TaxID=54128 RepID=A0ABD2XT47_9HYME